MNSTSYLDDDYIGHTREQLKKVEAIRKVLLEVLSVHEKSKTPPKPTQLSFISPEETHGDNNFHERDGETIRERVFGVMKTLIESKGGKSVRFSEITDYIHKNQIDMGKSTKPKNLVSSILGSELKKKSGGVIKKIRRGMYCFK